MPVFLSSAQKNRHIRFVPLHFKDSSILPVLPLERDRDNVPHVRGTLTLDLAGGHIAGVGVQGMAVVLDLIAVGGFLDRQLRREIDGSNDISAIAEQGGPILRAVSCTGRIRDRVGFIIIQRHPRAGCQHGGHLPIDADLPKYNHITFAALDTPGEHPYPVEVA